MEHEEKLNEVKMRMFRWMCGMSLRERRASAEQATISEQDGAAQLKPSASGLAPEDMEGILVKILEDEEHR